MRQNINKLCGKLSILIAVFAVIVATVCFGLTAIGCNSETNIDKAIRIAREHFGCEKILWMDGAMYRNSISGADKIDTEDGPVYTRDTVLGPEGGLYIIGLNKNGEELHILVPDNEDVKIDSSVKNPPSLKPTLFDWPFACPFLHMAAFMGEYGYQYADGIEGRVNEYISGSKKLYANDRASDIMRVYRGDDCEEFYNRLDVKFTFCFETASTKCVLAQESGKLKLYEWRFTDSDKSLNVHVLDDKE